MSLDPRKAQSFHFVRHTYAAGVAELVYRFDDGWRVVSDSVHPTLEAAQIRAEELARGKP